MMPRGAEVSIPKGFRPPTDFKSVSKAAWIDAAEEPTKLDLLVETRTNRSPNSGLQNQYYRHFNYVPIKLYPYDYFLNGQRVCNS